MLAVIAAVAIEDVERVDALEMMLFEPGGEDARHAGVEARAEQRHQARVLETVLLRPLPMIFELRLLTRFVIGGVHIIPAGRQARQRGRASCRDRLVQYVTILGG